MLAGGDMVVGLHAVSYCNCLCNCLQLPGECCCSRAPTPIASEGMADGWEWRPYNAKESNVGRFCYCLAASCAARVQLAASKG
jgi:hypothetical protein